MLKKVINFLFFILFSFHGNTYDYIPSHFNKQHLTENVSEHSISGIKAVYVTTYNFLPLAILWPIVIQTSLAEKEKYVVIQKGIYDGLDPAISPDSPYLLRPHPVVTPSGNAENVEVNITLSDQSLGENGEKINIIGPKHSTHTHDNTFSPNNMHLVNLPQRDLHENEIYSFISTITWPNHKPLETLHIICGDKPLEYFHHKIDQAQKKLEQFLVHSKDSPYNEFEYKINKFLKCK